MISFRTYNKDNIPFYISVPTEDIDIFKNNLGSNECNLISDSEVVGSGDAAKTHTGTVSGMESFTPDPSDADYIAYESLTNAKVVSWVKAVLGTDEVARVGTKVAAQITESKAPSSAWGVPW